MTELEKETIVACVAAAVTGIPAALLFWWTWRRDQERLKVLKIIDYWPTLDNGQVMAKDETGAPTLGILVRNRSLFPVRVSAAGFRLDRTYIRLENLYLPLRLKKNPDPGSNRPNIPDDSDPSEIRTGESLRINVRGQVDKAAISQAITEACQRLNVSAEDFVQSRRVAALVALETGREFTSMPFGKRIWRSMSEPLAHTNSTIKKIAIPLLFLLLGAILGGGSVEYGHRRLDIRSKARFEQRSRCKSLADAYARQNSTDNDYVTLRMVDFSEAQNSCIAGFNEWTVGDWRDWELVDLLTGKSAPIGSCNESKNCGEGRNIKFDHDLETAFKQAVAGGIK